MNRHDHLYFALSVIISILRYLHIPSTGQIRKGNVSVQKWVIRSTSILLITINYIVFGSRNVGPS